MATNPNTGGIRPVTPSHTAVPLRAGLVLSVEEATRIAEALVTIQQVAGRVGIHLIDKLDVMEGDPDLEDADADEEDDPSGQYDEDAWTTFIRAGDMFDSGPGCPIADPGGCEHDGREHDDGF